MEQRGFIFIADITGYTTYLSKSELEHAQETLADLLELLVEHTRPPLLISRLEGDAVLSYGLREGFVSGQTFLEAIEDSYVAFRRAIDLMVLNNSCQCNACANVSALDLKFFLHYGVFVLQRIGGHDELLGTDVNLIHRLLKNSVKVRTGLNAYLLCTQAAVEALGMEEAAAAMVVLRETVDELGEVDVLVKDMRPVFEARRDAERITLGPDEILGKADTIIDMSPALVWDYLNQSEFRNVLIGSDRTKVVDRRGGRIGEGTTFQCYHGKRMLPQLVLEWKPFERVLIRQALPLPGEKSHILMELRLAPVDGKTRLSQIVARPGGPAVTRWLAHALIPLMGKRAQRDIDAFRDRIEEDAAARGLVAPPATLPAEEIAAAAATSLEGNEQRAPGGE